MIEVTIIYQTDPLGNIAGGTDSFIRGILRWAPTDINFRLIGVSTDPEMRPVGKWTSCSVGGKRYLFFPVLNYRDPFGRRKIPLVVHFIMGIIRYKPNHHSDILDFHRIEPSALYLDDPRPKTAVIHQNMQDLYNKSSDVRWSKAPGIYFWLQDKLIPCIDSVFVVREDAVAWYKQRYPEIENKFRFTPTWYDSELFHPIDRQAKSKMRRRLGINVGEQLIVTVGRLDKAKDPLLLARAIKRVLREHKSVRLIYVGDGVLRNELESYITTASLEGIVRVTGLKAPNDVAEIVGAADLFVLPSAYEGMPICVLEALGAGVPIVSTDVGEIRRIVKNRVNGLVVSKHSDVALADAIIHVLHNLQDYAGLPCTNAVIEFTPDKVLQPIYDNYRRLANERVTA